MRKSIIIFITILICGGIVSGIVPKGTKISALQFDGIIELNAVSAKTHLSLFVRYIVTQDSYNASIIWAEPHIGTVNFPLYPPTTIIDSNDKGFSIVNEVNSQNNAKHSKPIGKRDVFRYMFGDYPVSNVRFAEQEALASRIFTNDLQNLSEPNNRDFQTIDISGPKDTNNTFREVAKLNIQSDGKYINALKLLDSKERLIKSIMYEYSTEKETPFLKRQNIELAERPILVGFKSGGVKITMNGQEQMIKEMVSTHHAGSRKCTVDYKTMKIGDKLISLPVQVVVYSGDGKNILRTSRLMNFKQVEINKDSDDKSTKDSASFDENEKQVRQMLLKYWMENPEKIEKDDLVKMKQMQKHFDGLSVKDFAGDQLRRINMLLQLDWILGDSENLPKHYQQYLNILKTNSMEQMLLYGGQQAIETTYRWNYYPLADKLLMQWLDAAVSLNNPDVILHFAKNAIEKDRFWETAQLLDKSLDSPKTWGQKQIYAEYSRCDALYGLYQMLQQPDKIPDGRKKEQANWVLSKTSMEVLLKTLNKEIDNAQKAFSSTENPDDEVKALKKQLDEMSQKIKQ